jgi:hypothetical protein
MMKFTQFGGVIIASAIDEFTITTHGAAEAIDPREVFNAVGMAQCDCWPDGHTARHRIDGTPVWVRRSGWRIEVWGEADADAPTANPLPPPPNATDPVRQRGSRVEIAEGYLEPPLNVPGFTARASSQGEESRVVRVDESAPRPADTVGAAAGALWRSLGAAAAQTLRRAERAVLGRL